MLNLTEPCLKSSGKELMAELSIKPSFNLCEIKASASWRFRLKDYGQDSFDKTGTAKTNLAQT